jgi:hypothetical protein
MCSTGELGARQPVEADVLFRGLQHALAMQLRRNAHAETTAVLPLGECGRRRFAGCLQVRDDLCDEGPDAGEGRFRRVCKAALQGTLCAGG